MDESNEIVVRIVQLDRILSLGSDFIQSYISDSSTQIHYSLGCHYFWHDNFQRAHSRLRECARQLKILSGCPPLVDPGQLRGFTCACAQVRTKRRAAGREGEEEEEGELESEGLCGGRQTLLEKLELCKIRDIEVYYTSGVLCMYKHITSQFNYNSIHLYNLSYTAVCLICLPLFRSLLTCYWSLCIVLTSTESSGTTDPGSDLSLHPPPYVHVAPSRPGPSCRGRPPGTQLKESQAGPQSGQLFPPPPLSGGRVQRREGNSGGSAAPAPVLDPLPLTLC